MVFLTERYNAADLPLDTGLMKKIREQAALRLQAAMDYVKGSLLQDAENTCVLWRRLSKWACAIIAWKLINMPLSDQDILAVYDWSRTLLVTDP